MKYHDIVYDIFVLKFEFSGTRMYKFDTNITEIFQVYKSIHVLHLRP